LLHWTLIDINDIRLDLTNILKFIFFNRIYYIEYQQISAIKNNHKKQFMIIITSIKFKKIIDVYKISKKIEITIILINRHTIIDHNKNYGNNK